MKRVRESLLPWKSNKYCTSLCVRERVRACTQARGRVLARACVHVTLLIQHATYMRHILMSFVAPEAPPYVSTLSHTRHDFRKK